MSLIQEALKRKTEEAPAVPPPDAPPPAPQPGGNAPQPLMIGLIVLLIIALLVALGGLAIALINPAKATRPAEQPPQENPAPVTPQPAVETPVSAPLPAVEQPAPAEAPAVAPVAVEPPVNEAWPELKLTGIAASGTQRIAIINDKMLTAGRRIGDVIVCEVRETDAIVEFRGERRILHVDE